jgi:hypothetical protein
MYLISTADFPFSPSDIRHGIGLKTDRLDLLIAAGIATICTISTRLVRSETWAIRVGDDFEERVNRYGRPIFVGEPRRIDAQDPHLCRNVTWAADPEAVLIVRDRICAWCVNQPDIAEAMALEAWPTPVTDPARLGLFEAVQTALEVV